MERYIQNKELMKSAMSNLRACLPTAAAHVKKKGHVQAKVSLEEFNWNLKRLIREGFPEGIPTLNLQETYKDFYERKVEPSTFQYDVKNWGDLFRKNELLKKTYFIGRKQSQELVKIKNDIAHFTKDEIRKVLGMTNYSKKVEKSKGCCSDSDSEDSCSSDESVKKKRKRMVAKSTQVSEKDFVQRIEEISKEAVAVAPLPIRVSSLASGATTTSSQLLETDKATSAPAPPKTPIFPSVSGTTTGTSSQPLETANPKATSAPAPPKIPIFPSVSGTTTTGTSSQPLETANPKATSVPAPPKIPIFPSVSGTTTTGTSSQPLETANPKATSVPAPPKIPIFPSVSGTTTTGTSSQSLETANAKATSAPAPPKTPISSSVSGTTATATSSQALQPLETSKAVSSAPPQIPIFLSASGTTVTSSQTAKVVSSPPPQISTTASASGVTTLTFQTTKAATSTPVSSQVQCSSSSGSGTTTFSVKFVNELFFPSTNPLQQPFPSSTKSTYSSVTRHHHESTTSRVAPSTNQNENIREAKASKSANLTDQSGSLFNTGLSTLLPTPRSSCTVAPDPAASIRSAKQLIGVVPNSQPRIIPRICTAQSHRRFSISDCSDSDCYDSDEENNKQLKSRLDADAPLTVSSSFDQEPVSQGQIEVIDLEKPQKRKSEKPKGATAPATTKDISKKSTTPIGNEITKFLSRAEKRNAKESALLGSAKIRNQSEPNEAEREKNARERMILNRSRNIVKQNKHGKHVESEHAPQNRSRNTEIIGTRYRDGRSSGVLEESISLDLNMPFNSGSNASENSLTSFNFQQRNWNSLAPYQMPGRYEETPYNESHRSESKVSVANGGNQFSFQYKRRSEITNSPDEEMSAKRMKTYESNNHEESILEQDTQSQSCHLQISMDKRNDQGACRKKDSSLLKIKFKPLEIKRKPNLMIGYDYDIDSEGEWHLSTTPTQRLSQMKPAATAIKNGSTADPIENRSESGKLRPKAIPEAPPLSFTCLEDDDNYRIPEICLRMKCELTPLKKFTPLTEPLEFNSFILSCIRLIQGSYVFPQPIVSLQHPYGGKMNSIEWSAFVVQDEITEFSGVRNRGYYLADERRTYFFSGTGWTETTLKLPPKTLVYGEYVTRIGYLEPDRVDRYFAIIDVGFLCGKDLSALDIVERRRASRHFFLPKNVLSIKNMQDHWICNVDKLLDQAKIKDGNAYTNDGTFYTKIAGIELVRKRKRGGKPVDFRTSMNERYMIPYEGSGVPREEIMNKIYSKFYVRPHLYYY